MTKLFSLLLLLFFAGCATLPKPSAPPLAGEMPVQAVCQKYNMDCQWDAVSQTVTMLYQGRKIQALVGSDQVVAGREHYKLASPLRSQKGVVMLPPDFERTVLGVSPVVQSDIVRGAMTGLLKKIVIDAGHGGKDPGAIGLGGIKEKDITLDVARRVQKAFSDLGIQVVMTRSSDDYPSLPERTALASQPGVDLFVSIHANAGAGRRARGIEVYYPGPLNVEDKAELQRQNNEKKLASQLNMRHDIPDLRAIVADLVYSFKLRLSSGLADAVARGFAHESMASIRGSKTARYFVLRNNLMPAILVEIGFLTNPREASLLREPEYRQKIADTIVRSILRYVHDADM